ncbi:MAG TPA: AAA family ATPase, partial [Methylocella sp.]|nr:AAA family ATPase [Methylocella sp.]
MSSQGFMPWPVTREARMRLKRLDLIRYGKFTDYRLDFGETSPNEPDLHIVYGPNEAGKSTAFAGYLDLLYGIEPRSRFDFLHSYKNMRISAALDLGTGERELIRLKRPQNSLLDANEQPVPESDVLTELSGIDRESYRTMFSLDDQTLEAGGESILASQGDLGQLLFSASAGLAELSTHLEELRTEAHEFYKYRARSGELSDLKKRLAELKVERESLDTQASHYAKLVESRDRAKSQYEAAIGERGRIHARIEEIQRLLNALPRLSELHVLRATIKPFVSLPEPPPGWNRDFPALQKDDIELAVQEQSLAAEIEKLTATHEAIVVDEKVLEQAEKFAALDGLRARYLTADDDLDNRRMDLQASEHAIAGILDRIDCKDEADPARLILSANVLGPLRCLMEARSGIDAALTSAQDEVAQARQRLAEAQAKLSAEGEDRERWKDARAGMAALEACVTKLQAGDHSARLQLLESELAARREALENRLSVLRPWQDDPRSLTELTVPDQAVIEHWKVALTAAEQEIFRRKAAVESLTAEQLDLEAERTAIDHTIGVVSNEEADRVRRARESSWAAHRQKLDLRSADEFETAMREDDRITTTRFTHMAEVAKRHHASQKLIMVEAKLRRAQALEEEAKTALQKLHDEIGASLRTFAPELGEPLSLLKVESWLSSRTKALEAWSSVRSAEGELRRAEADADKARRKLAAALSAAGLPYKTDAAFEDLLALARTKLDHESELIKLHEAVEERQRDLDTREHKERKAMTADRSWSAGWSLACSGCWLGEKGTIPQLSVVREILVGLAGLGPALENKASLAYRVEAMEADQAKFAEALAEIANDLNLFSEKATPLELHSIIGALIQQARSAKAAREAKEQELNDARRRLQAHGETQAIHERRKTQLLTFFGAASLAEAGTALQNVATKAELQGQIDKAATALLDATGLPALDEAEQALAKADRAALITEL